MSPETSSAQDGTGNGRPTKLASSGMKPPSATRREYHMAPEWLLHQSLYSGASVRGRQPPGAALHQTTLTRHLAGSDKIRRVPWRVSPAQPAILASVANIWAGFQELTLQSLTPSEEVDSIHCVFCLTEDEDHANDAERSLIYLAWKSGWKGEIQALAPPAVCVETKVP
ncbi:hypothetical protein PENARI_c110G08266, partial [Penicillium arizonense]